LLRMKKFSYLFAVLFCLSILAASGSAPAIAATQPTDINGHWAHSQIANMIEQGVFAGYPDGTFKPDTPITRAEFITVINRAFNFTATANSSYTDVSSSDWFMPEVAQAQAAGYISGYLDGSMKPDQQISRQEVAIIVVKVMHLDIAGTDALTKFTDFAAIPTWSSPACAAMVKEGLMGGYPDGTFQAGSPTSRAMVAVILNQAIGKKPSTIYSLPGTYGPATGMVTINGSVIIDAAGITLQNMIITGNLIISSSVGQGNADLKNVTVRGTTLIQSAK